MDIEVRCCCNPEKIYGTLDIARFKPRHGLELTYRYVDIASGPKRVTLTMCDLLHVYKDDGTYGTVIAFKKPHELTLEELRKIKEFKEVEHA